MMGIDRVPEHLIVIGGSYIGLEFAQMYRRFGSQVTVVEMAPRLIAREDADVSTAVQAILEAEGIDVPPGGRMPVRRARGDAGVAVHVSCERAPRTIARIPSAARRRPCAQHAMTSDSSAPGVETDAHGYIVVDDAAAHQRPGHLGARRRATAAARSPTPRTTTTRSSPPTCSTATTAASATACPSTRSSPIRRWRASA